MIKTVTFAGFAALLSVASLAAQQHGHGQAPDTTAIPQPAQQTGQMPMTMMQGGMMPAQGMDMMPGHLVMQRAMRLSPARLLAHKDDLGLTPQQTAQLEQLASRDSAAPRERMAAMKRAGEELTRLFDAAKPDTAAIRVAAEQLVAQHGAQHARRLATAAAARGILSAAQLEKAMLLGGCDMQSMMQGMMQGGMMGEGGMMRGMMQRERPDSPPEHERHHQPPPDGR